VVELDFNGYDSKKTFNNVLKVHIFNAFDDSMNIVRCGLNACDFFDEYVAIEESVINHISFTNTGNCYINFYDKNLISSMIDNFETYLTKEFLSDAKVVRILNISGNIGNYDSEADRYSYIYLLNRLCVTFINANNRYETKINLDIPDFRPKKDYDFLCKEGKIPKDILKCDGTIKEKISAVEPPYSSVQIEFGCGYNPSPFSQLKMGNKLVYVDPIFKRSRNIMGICIQIKSKINDLLDLFLKFPTNSKNITRILSSRAMQCLTMDENVKLLNLLSKICMNEFISIVPDYKLIMKKIGTDFGNVNHHISNSALFGFDDWDLTSSNKCVWTEGIMKSYLEKMKNLYSKTYRLKAEYDIFPTELNGNKCYIRGELFLK